MWNDYGVSSSKLPVAREKSRKRRELPTKNWMLVYTKIPFIWYGVKSETFKRILKQYKHAHGNSHERERMTGMSVIIKLL